jgi:hypothetical protein
MIPTNYLVVLLTLSVPWMANTMLSATEEVAIALQGTRYIGSTASPENFNDGQQNLQTPAVEESGASQDAASASRTRTGESADGKPVVQTAESDIDLFESFPDRAANNPGAFDGFEIDAVSAAERNAALRAASEAAMHQEDDNKLVIRSEITSPDDRSPADGSEASLSQLYANGQFLVPEPSSWMAWLLVCAVTAAAIYRDVVLRVRNASELDG